MKALKSIATLEVPYSEPHEFSDVLTYHEYANVDPDEQDQAIACHSFIDTCNGSIAYRLIEQLKTPCAGKVVLDAGAGTGQVTGLLLAFRGLIVEACDVDPDSAAFLR